MSTTTVKEFAIVKAIMAVLKLDDAGKISKFFTQEIKTFREAIEGLELNLQVAALKRKKAVSKFDKNIEDATEAVEAAYVAVTPENVALNKSMTAFSSEYWSGIETAEGSLNYLQKQAERATEEYDKEVAYIKEQIAKYKARIAKLSK